MSEEVWLSRLTHALSTETKEIMGLDFSAGTSNIQMMRYDHRKDRVKTNPKPLAAASLQDEKMTLTTGSTTQVIGWYHPHPHITILPSHVDVRTQAMYQLLDAGSIRLTLSCFSEDAKKVGRIQVIVFQSMNRDAWKQRDRGNSLVAYTGDSTFDTIADTDCMDMTPSMQEALHLSNLEVSGAEYVRKEVPLKVVPAIPLLKLEHPLNSFTDLQEELFKEDQAAYKEAISHNVQDGKIHPLTFIHLDSTYQAILCKLMEYCLSPAISALQDTLKENEIRLSILMKEVKSLETEGHGRENESSFGPPRRASRRGAF
ncbi:lys-63-specific deubiquitinase BRCC36-like [Dioscorea cayenensis subsp. rotundata]|uniref:Lys-63-specific deubiquitinase BRCC36-like n=1 Tax=Dioscorea cayennensis subsp. rotundata TaxID=55577 RepID=A0AB40BN47_DIOCR|nr:lys-63-specific deubiquitinase BRCC36-like [Dioscorea cayenensis subsp. rotundata]